MPRRETWPPYELVDAGAVAAAEAKSRRLERLYHLTQEHAWDGKAVLAGLVEKHGIPGKDLPVETRGALTRLLCVLLWGELAAWTISADLALSIDDMDAKMAATGQVFDEARHFSVMRDYLLLLGRSLAEEGAAEGLPRLGGVARTLLLDVMGTPSLARKLIGMQLLFETNAVVIFRRLGESGVCPVLRELLPYFERDESRHVGLGVLYLPRLIERMSRAEAASTALYQLRCIGMLMAGGIILHEDFERLGLDPRLMATRVTAMQEDVVRQMVEAHGQGIGRAILNPNATPLSATLIDFIHPLEGMRGSPPWYRAFNGGVRRAVVAVDRALA